MALFVFLLGFFLDNVTVLYIETFIWRNITFAFLIAIVIALELMLNFTEYFINSDNLLANSFAC